MGGSVRWCPRGSADIDWHSAYVDRVASKYQALTEYLSERSDPVVELTFAELDRLVGGMPASARKHQAWWANSRSAQPHAKYWLDATRRANPDFNAGRVRFEIGAETVGTPRVTPAVVATHRSTASLVPTGEVVRAAVDFEWLIGGAVTLDSAEKPVFPGVPSRPGLYRFRLVAAEGLLEGVYIGESDNLARRMGNYRNPGPKQPTNQRLNSRFREVLAGGGAVELSVATAVTVDGEPIDLVAKPARLLAENAALIRAAQEGLPVENL